MIKTNLNITPIGSSHLKQLLISKTPAKKVQFDYYSNLSTNLVIFTMQDSEKITIKIPDYFCDYPVHILLKDLFDYLRTNLRENYPEYYI